jgi:hypothetical protein
MGADQPLPNADAALLEQLLGSLLYDYAVWFERGELLVELCPDAVMPADQRQSLRQALQQASRELAAAAAVRDVMPVPLALPMDLLAPWHQLVMRVWSLSSRLRGMGVALPPLHWPDPPAG